MPENEVLITIGADTAGAERGLKNVRRDIQGMNSSLSLLTRTLLGVSFIGLGHQAIRLGLDMAKMAEEASGGEQTFKRLAESTKGLKQALGELLLPTVRDVNRGLSEFFQGAAKGLGQFREDWAAFQGIFQGKGPLGGNLAQGFWRQVAEGPSLGMAPADEAALEASRQAGRRTETDPLIQAVLAFHEREARVAVELGLRTMAAQGISPIAQGMSIADVERVGRWAETMPGLVSQLTQAVFAQSAQVEGLSTRWFELSDAEQAAQDTMAQSIVTRDEALEMLRDLADAEAQRIEDQQAIIASNNEYVKRYLIDLADQTEREAERKARAEEDAARRAAQAWREAFDLMAQAQRGAGRIGSLLAIPATLGPPGSQRFGHGGLSWPTQDPERVRLAREESARRGGAFSGGANSSGNIVININGKAFAEATVADMDDALGRRARQRNR